MLTDRSPEMEGSSLSIATRTTIFWVGGELCVPFSLAFSLVLTGQSPQKKGPSFSLRLKGTPRKNGSNFLAFRVSAKAKF